MELSIGKFTFFYLMYTAILAALAFGLSLSFPDTPILISKFWAVFVFMCGITYIAYVVAFLGIKRSPETGVFSIMGSIILKMFFSMAFVLIYSLKGEEKGVVFVLNFFSLYLFFSFFEIYCLLRNLRHQNK